MEQRNSHIHTLMAKTSMRQRATSVTREATLYTYSIFTHPRLQGLWSQFGAGYFAQGHADLLAAQEMQFLHIFRLSKTSKIKWRFNKVMVGFIDKDAEELALAPGDAFQDQRAFSTIAFFDGLEAEESKIRAT